MRVNRDLQLTLMAGRLYDLLEGRVAHGYQSVNAPRMFRDLIGATATARIRVAPGPRQIQRAPEPTPTDVHVRPMIQ